MYPQYGSEQYGTSPAYVPLPPDAPQPPPGIDHAAARRRERRRHGARVAAGLGVLAIAGAALGLSISTATSQTTVGLGNALPSTSSGSGSFGSGSSGNGSTGNGSSGSGSTGSGSTGTGSGSGSTGSGSTGSGGTQTSQGSATTAQQVGIVDIDSVLGYQSAEAAGTGMILTSNGEILTNNHVIDGATKITVTVVATGKTYTATVVGTDKTQDVAVLQLANASGLKTANLGDSSSVKVGDRVTGVGNAGGVGGTPSAASGTVQALDQAITATDDSGGNSENLTGLIESNAPIQAGDSGGPLYNSSGKIVGMDTAAQTAGGQGGFGSQSSQNQVASEAYSIPINTALKIAGEIESGTSSSTITQGYPGFIGVSIVPDSSTTGGSTTGGSGSTGSSSGSGATVSQALPDTPAATAGITAGSVITAVGGHTITSADNLSSVMATYKPGQKVSISWTDQSGQSHTATITLIAGPAN